MDDRSELEDERSEEPEHLGGIGYRGESLWIDDIRLTTDNCPDCLKRDRFNCNDCTHFEPERCRLRRSALDREEIRHLFDIQREHRLAQLKRQKTLIRAVRTELKAHGRPLHYTVLARMVAERHPKLNVNEHGVLMIMNHHPEEFECIEAGVYKCK
jgi:hypothetical protein